MQRFCGRNMGDEFITDKGRRQEWMKQREREGAVDKLPWDKVT